MYFTESLVRQRESELRAAAVPRPPWRPRLRRRLGWVLVEAGLRLAVEPAPAVRRPA